MLVTSEAEDLSAFLRTVDVVNHNCFDRFSKSRLNKIYESSKVNYPPYARFKTISEYIKCGRISTEVVVNTALYYVVQGRREEFFTRDINLAELEKMYFEKFSKKSLHKSNEIFKITFRQAKEQLGIQEVSDYYKYRQVSEQKVRGNYSLMYNLLAEGNVSPSYYLHGLDHFKISRLKVVRYNIQEEERYRNLLKILLATETK